MHVYHKFIVQYSASLLVLNYSIWISSFLLYSVDHDFKLMNYSSEKVSRVNIAPNNVVCSHDRNNWEFDKFEIVVLTGFFENDVVSINILSALSYILSKKLTYSSKIQIDLITALVWFWSWLRFYSTQQKILSFINELRTYESTLESLKVFNIFKFIEPSRVSICFL